VDTKAISIKAKTPEGLGLDHVAQAHATVLLEKVEDPEEIQSMSAVIENQRHLEDVVRDLLAEVHGTSPQRPTVKVKVFDTEDIT
jgi:2-C-methyl-D-erythritol 2,4-cyclodiphosphate synthase